MKNRLSEIPSALGGLTSFTVAAVFMLSVANLNSQYAAPGTLPPDPAVAATLPKTPEAVLSKLKAANAALLQQQQTTLQRIDAIQQEADQLRIYSRRS